MASPFTNLLAPSIAPKKSASLCTSFLLFLAVSSSISPEFKSASIAICLPGIASKVNLAATSATLSEPLVITMNWMATSIRNTMKPTTTLPDITKLPKVYITSPACPLFERISLVADMLRPSLNKVMINNSEGKIENCRGSVMYNDVRRTTIDKTRLSSNRKSKAIVPSGMIISTIIAIMARDTIISPILSINNHLCNFSSCKHKQVFQPPLCTGFQESAALFP